MKRVLIPVDFSICSYKAIDFAVQAARYLDISITLLHCYENESSIYADYMGMNKGFNEAVLSGAQKKLEEAKNIIQETEGISVDTYLAVTPFREAVRTSIEELNINYIIMGTVGASGVKERIWGSKTAGLIGNIPVPMLIIPIEYDWKKPEKILFTTNHFEKTPAVLDYIFEMADLFLARTNVLVMTDVDDDAPDIFLEHSRAVAPYEQFLRQQYQEKELKVDHLYGKHFEETLQAYLKANSIDILVMVTYKKGFWQRLFRPGMTKHMSYQTSIPMLAIPAE